MGLTCQNIDSRPLRVSCVTFHWEIGSGSFRPCGVGVGPLLHPWLVVSHKCLVELGECVKGGATCQSNIHMNASRMHCT